MAIAFPWTSRRQRFGVDFSRIRNAFQRIGKTGNYKMEDIKECGIVQAGVSVTERGCKQMAVKTE